MAKMMALQRVEWLKQLTPEQFCRVNKDQDIRCMILREIQEHIDAINETLAEISKSSLPEEFKNELLNEFLPEREMLTPWVDVLKKEVKQ